MSTICRSCGEFLSMHKDGRCDPVAARAYRRDQQNHFRRSPVASNQPQRPETREPGWVTVD